MANCYKCSKPAAKVCKRTDNFKSVWGKPEWMPLCLKHLNEQVGKYPMEIKDANAKMQENISVHKVFNLNLTEREKVSREIIWKNMYKTIILTDTQLAQRGFNIYLKKIELDNTYTIEKLNKQMLELFSPLNKTTK